jgi:hypothetical protein
MASQDCGGCRAPAHVTGKQLKAAGLGEDELECVTSATVGGVHVGPLTVFCLLELLDFSTGLPQSAARSARASLIRLPGG